MSQEPSSHGNTAPQEDIHTTETSVASTGASTPSKEGRSEGQSEERSEGRSEERSEGRSEERSEGQSKNGQESSASHTLYDAEPPRLNLRQQLALSAYWFATNLHWGAFLLLLIPFQAKQIMPENPPAAMSWIFGIGALMALTVPLVVGSMSDRSISKWGRRRPFLAVGVCINLIGLLVMAYGGWRLSLPFYLFGYLIIQFGNNSASAAYTGIIPDIVPESQRGEASGYMATMTQLGTIVGVLGTGILLGKQNELDKATGHPGQQYIFIVYAAIAVVMLLFMLVTLFTVHETPLTVQPQPMSFNKFIRDLIEPLKFKDFFWVLVTRAFVTAGMWVVQPYIQDYLEDVMHDPNAPATAGYLLLVILLTATVTALIGGKISDKVGRKVVIYVANTLIAVCSVAFVFSTSIGMTFLIGAFYGIGYGAYYSVDWALACDVLPQQENAGKDMGIWHVSLVLPQTFAPALAGYILGVFGHTTAKRLDTVTGKMTEIAHFPVAGYQAAFCVAALFLILGAVLLRNVSETKNSSKS